MGTLLALGGGSVPSSWVSAFLLGTANGYFWRPISLLVVRCCSHHVRCLLPSPACTTAEYPVAPSISLSNSPSADSPFYGTSRTFSFTRVRISFLTPFLTSRQPPIAFFLPCYYGVRSRQGQPIYSMLGTGAWFLFNRLVTFPFVQ